MKETRRFAHKADVIVTDLGNELVLLDPSSREMFSLNAVGRVIWQELPGRSLGQVVEKITAAFEVTREEALADVLELVDSLLEAELIKET